MPKKYGRLKPTHPPLKQKRERAAAACLDCKRPYSDFAVDLVLPRDQWLAIHPGDSGVLCPSCIVVRAGQLKGVSVVHAVVAGRIGRPSSPR